MADNKYQPGVYRKAGGAELVVTSTGKVNVEAGGYIQNALVAHTTALSPLIRGAMNHLGGGTSCITVVLPDPAVGADVWVINTAATTGAYSIEAASTNLGVDREIGSSTEVGTFVDSNTILLSSGGCLHHLKAVSTSQWIVVSNIGASVCTTIEGTSL